jgi:hypothetical protein
MLGLNAIVGSVVLIGAGILIKRHDRARATAVVIGAAPRAERRWTWRLACVQVLGERVDA